VSNRYLDAVRQGNNAGWRYLLSLLLIIFFWLILGSIPLFVWLAGNFQGEPVITIGGNSRLLKYILFSLSFCFFLLGQYLAVTLIHQRPFRSLIQPQGRVNYTRILQGAIVWLLLISFTYGVEALLHPSHFKLTFNPVEWSLFLPLVLLLTPIQTTAEELFFRGYLLQGLGLLSRNRWFLIGVTSLIFGSLHFSNPEMGAASNTPWLSMLYVAFGAFLAVITLKDKGLELAIGCHAINNLFLVTVVRDQVAVLNTPAMFTRIATPDARTEFFIFLGQALLFYLWLFYPRQRQMPIKDSAQEIDMTQE
jgi:membrane protease YdiL (CAAX protease family)